jgi:hypothetical protein
LTTGPWRSGQSHLAKIGMVAGQAVAVGPSASFCCKHLTRRTRRTTERHGAVLLAATCVGTECNKMTDAGGSPQRARQGMPLRVAPWSFALSVLDAYSRTRAVRSLDRSPAEPAANAIALPWRSLGGDAAAGPSHNVSRTAHRHGSETSSLRSPRLGELCDKFTRNS